MSEVTVRQMPAFKRAYKKLHPNQKDAVNETIRAIIADPMISEPKKGDLADVYMYKFDVVGQRMLLAYEWDPSQRLLLALGVHENFYRDLRR